MLLPASSFNAPLEALPLRVTPAARLRSLYMTAVAAPFRRHASLFSSSGFLLKRFVFFSRSFFLGPSVVVIEQL